MHDNNDSPEQFNLNYDLFLQISGTLFRPKFYRTLTGSELKVYGYLLFLFYQFAKKNGNVFELTPTFLANATGLSAPTCNRVLKSLCGKLLLRRLAGPRNASNRFAIMAVFLYDKKKKSVDQFDLPTSISVDQNDQPGRSKRSTEAIFPGTPVDHFDLQIDINTLNRDDASRQRCPSDSIKEQNQEKGVGLLPDSHYFGIEKVRRDVALVRANIDRLTQEEKAVGRAGKGASFTPIA